MSFSNPELAARYGRTPNPRLQRLGKALLAILVTIFLAAVLWVGYVVATPPIKATLVTYEHGANNTLLVTFQVVRQPNTPVTCGVEALDSRRAQVGFQNVDVPATPDKSTLVKAELRVQGEAVSADIKNCHVRH